MLGKEPYCFLTKFLSWNISKKLVQGSLNFIASCSRDVNILSKERKTQIRCMLLMMPGTESHIHSNRYENDRSYCRRALQSKMLPELQPKCMKWTEHSAEHHKGAETNK